MGNAELESLGEFSAGFAQRLFAERPELRSFASASRLSGGGEDYLVLKVPAPAGSQLDARGLFVTTQDREVTICLDHWHGHYAWPPSEPGTNDPVAVIGAILDDDMILVSAWRDGLCRWGVLQKRGEVAIRRPGFAIRIRSWSGLLDADEQG